MRKEAVKLFMSALGVDPSLITENGDWVNCRCPLSKYTHERGDESPSFGIWSSVSRHSVWRCFGCSADALRLDKLLTKLFINTGKYPFRAAQILVKNENFAGTDKDLDISGGAYDVWASNNSERKSRLLPVSKKVPIPGRTLKNIKLLQFDESEGAGRCRMYLTEKRGISLWEVYNSGIRSMFGRLAFPLTDHDGNIYTLRIRDIYEKKVWTIDDDSAGLPDGTLQPIRATGVWFGLHLVDWERAVTLVEGEMDKARLASLGYPNTIASTTSSVTFEQLENLSGSVYFLGYDSDKAGMAARKRIIKYFNGSVQLFDLDWSIVKNKEGGKCKDAGDLVDKESAQYVFRHAKYIS